MKQVFTTVLFLFVVQCGWSQMDIRPRVEVRQLPDSFFAGKHFSPVFKSRIISPDSLRYSHRVASGRAYLSAMDGMPCMKPDTSFVYNMPVHAMPNTSSIPNGYRPGSGLIILKRKY